MPTLDKYILIFPLKSCAELASWLLALLTNSVSQLIGCHSRTMSVITLALALVSSKCLGFRFLLSHIRQVTGMDNTSCQCIVCHVCVIVTALTSYVNGLCIDPVLQTHPRQNSTPITHVTVFWIQNFVTVLSSYTVTVLHVWVQRQSPSPSVSFLLSISLSAPTPVIQGKQHNNSFLSKHLLLLYQKCWLDLG